MRVSKNVLMLAVLVTLPAQPVLAGNYPLELTNIRPAGSGLNAGNRIYRAYPGIEYNIRAAVVGGDYPYTFSLANAPSGMTVNSGTGEIRWLSPQANAQPTLTVRDSAGATVSATWSIQVTTSGFRFVNAGAAAGGNGTIGSPWRSLSDVYYNAAPSDLVYFRAGTYSQLTLPRDGVGGDWERVDWSGKASIWLAYPGERPIIDFGYRPGGSERAPLIRLDGDNVYIDGFETVYSRLIAFQFTSVPGSGPTFRRLRMHAHGPGTDGSNASFIMTTTDAVPSNYMVVQDSEFYDVTGASVTIKIYAQNKLLIEDTVHHDAPVAIELKDDVRQFTVRNNRLYNISNTAIGGNMHETTTHGEILYNLSRANLAVRLNQDGMARQIYVYRNTFVGRVQVSATDSADGPFVFGNNVIVNGDSGTPSGSHVYHDEVWDPSRVILSNNLAGYPTNNIVDANGNLTSEYSSYLGTHGYQVPGGTWTPPTPAPVAPTNLRIIR